MCVLWTNISSQGAFISLEGLDGFGRARMLRSQPKCPFKLLCSYISFSYIFLGSLFLFHVCIYLLLYLYHLYICLYLSIFLRLPLSISTCPHTDCSYSSVLYTLCSHSRERESHKNVMAGTLGSLL